MSPLLYSIYVMGMIEELQKEGLGVKIEGIWCGGLLYADGIVLIADSGEELQNVVQEYAKQWRFKFNARKSKSMVIGRMAENMDLTMDGEVLEEVEAFKYLGVWFDKKLKGNIQLVREDEGEGRRVGREGVEWMSKVDGQVEVDRGRLVWELLARPSLEHAAEVWWHGGKAARAKLEATQLKVGRRLLGASKTVAGVAVQGDPGWRKLEERREEKKLLYGLRLDTLEDDRLVKVVADELATIGCWDDYDRLVNKYELDEEECTRSVRGWKEKIKDKNEEDWIEEVNTISSLRWYGLAKSSLATERYVKSVEDHEAVRLRFRLRSGSAGLLQEKRDVD